MSSNAMGSYRIYHNFAEIKYGIIIDMIDKCIEELSDIEEMRPSIYTTDREEIEMFKKNAITSRDLIKSKILFHKEKQRECNRGI